MERYRPFWGVQTDVHDRCFSSSSLDELLSKSASAGIGSSVRGGMELSSSFSSSPINFVDFAGLRGGFDPERNPFTGYKFIQFWFLVQFCEGILQIMSRIVTADRNTIRIHLFDQAKPYRECKSKKIGFLTHFWRPKPGQI